MCFRGAQNSWEGGSHKLYSELCSTTVYCWTLVFSVVEVDWDCCCWCCCFLMLYFVVVAVSLFVVLFWFWFLCVVLLCFVCVFLVVPV